MRRDPATTLILELPNALRMRAGRLLAAALVAVALIAHSAPVAGASPIDVIRDCSEDGALNGKYSQDELSGALDQLPSDLDEYTDCRSVIRRAQLAGARGKGAARAAKSVVSKVDTSTGPSPSEQRKLAQADEPGRGVEVGGRVLRPGESGAPLAAAGLGTDLPTPVLVVLVLLGLAMAAGAVYAAQRRWPQAWQAAGSTLGATAGRIRDGVRRGISRRR